MKDFHDLHSIISSSEELSFRNLEGIIRMVFEHRETKITLPITYEEDEMNRMQNFWNEYLKNLRAENLAQLPKNFADAIAKINNWLRLNTRIISQSI